MFKKNVILLNVTSFIGISCISDNLNVYCTIDCDNVNVFVVVWDVCFLLFFFYFKKNYKLILPEEDNQWTIYHYKIMYKIHYNNMKFTHPE